jgi:ubiquinone/menaquinone biosynthesis C-methylase UbiE|tara:strand:+ start:3043 stop:3801 length:759 start_codon:yes stop_codon:yes gene_type:complete
MERIRKPFQGILNIIRFNWHLYIIAIVLVVLIIFVKNFTNTTLKMFLQIVGILISITVFASVSISYYVYDLSGFYRFDWIKKDQRKISIVNINAGFDETSELLKKKFENSNFTALDFYNPYKHTEISIKRARKQYPPHEKTKEIKTSKIDLEGNSIDKVFVILSAHEIRNNEERILFFCELNRILKPKGQIVVIEHLRDLSNFIAYNVGAFHFHSKSTWLNNFNNSNLKLVTEIKSTPFISIFILEKNGSTL